MSLRAKLEAVIYAAEEPVTLTQLAALFSDEALEWKAQQDAAVLNGEALQEPLEPRIDEGLAYLGLDQTPEFYSAAGILASEDTEEKAVEPAILSPAPAEQSPPGDEAATAAALETVSGDDPEAEAKRLTRQRDRDVKEVLRQILDQLIASYAADEQGIEIREIAGGYRMATKPACHDAVRSFIRSQKPPLKLSLPALETLAVIAYKQPVTAPEVNEIRGVDSSGVFGSLLSRKLITTAGRKQVIGRPILYKTTKEFLLRFGLKDVSELPSMEEFEKMAAVELTETDESEGIAGPGPDSGPELDENAPEDDAAQAGQAGSNRTSPSHAGSAEESGTSAESAASKDEEEARTAPHG
jgi:segregation and condensation protein B